MHDLANNVKVTAAIPPKANMGAANYTGTTIDRNGFESLAFLINLAAAGDTFSGSLKLTYSMEHALDDGTGAAGSWDAVEADDVIAPDQSALVASAASGVVLTVDADAEAGKSYAVGYRGGRRFVRLNSAKTGTHTTGTPGGAVAVLGHPAKSPVT